MYGGLYHDRPAQKESESSENGSHSRRQHTVPSIMEAMIMVTRSYLSGNPLGHSRVRCPAYGRRHRKHLRSGLLRSGAPEGPDRELTRTQDALGGTSSSGGMVIRTALNIPTLHDDLSPPSGLASSRCLTPFFQARSYVAYKFDRSWRLPIRHRPFPRHTTLALSQKLTRDGHA